MPILLSLSLISTMALSEAAESALCNPDLLVAPSRVEAGLGFTSQNLLVASADFDNDTHADLLVSALAQSLSVLKGDGQGGFAPPQISTYPTLAGLGEPAIADFDMDGARDLAFASYDRIPIWLGNGDGTFGDTFEITPPQVFGIRFVRTALLNADSVPDLIYVTHSFSSIEVLSVWYGDGDGTFTAGPLYTFEGNRTADVVLQNLDADVAIEAAVLMESGDLTYFDGNGIGGFLPAVSLASGVLGSGLAAGDVNSDGRPDLVAAGGFAYGVLYGAPSGGFYASIVRSVSSLRTPLHLVDLDADGDLDLAGLTGSDFSPGGSFVVLRGDGQGNFEETRYLVGPRLVGFTLADFDEDGLPEAALSGTGTAAYLLAGVGEAVFTAPRLFWPETSGPLLASDFDADGVDDLLTFDGEGILTFLGGHHETLPVSSPNPIGTSVTSGDFDGDGLEDLLGFGGDSLVVLRGGGDGTFAGEIVTVLGPSSFALPTGGDWNGDQALDVAFWNGTSILVYQNDGAGTFLPIQSIPFCCPTIIPTSMHAADLNGDGFDDLVASQSSIVVYLSLGTTFGPGTPYAPGFFSNTYLEDVDSDGLPDVAFFSGSDALGWLAGNGDGTFDPPVYVAADFGRDLEVFDLDGDAIMDLLIASSENLMLLRGLGGGTFENPRLFFLEPGGGLEMAVLPLAGGSAPDVVLEVGSGLFLFENSRLSVQTVAVSACLDSGITVTASASGYGRVSYQWRRDGQELSDGGNVSGATSDTLTIDPATAADDGAYDVVVTDLCTSVTSAGVPITVSTAPAAPTITASASVPSATTGLIASVPDVPGHDFAWTLTGGTITAGQGTSQITFTSGDPGTTMTLEVVQISPAGCGSPESSKQISVDYLDVAASDPFRGFINTITRNGVTAGCGGGNYCPDQLVTRAQMAVFLLVSKNGAGYTPPPATGVVFLDVPASAFAAAFIEALAAAQVTSGCGGGNYCPDFFITRAEMAVFLLRTLEGPLYNPPPAVGTVFGDVGINDFAAAWIEELADRGITGGCGGGNFCPNAFVSRAHMAVFLTTTFDLQ
jgi:hypothetical protein